ncbi:MAG: hypothetical protein M3068_00195 [Gemmatimonadota bacterium]|nr:hypothetical protein [Gemmatimonadota bacterium]
MTPYIRGTMAAALITCAGCVYAGKQVTAGSNGRGVGVGVGVTRGWVFKEVVTKQEPHTLLALDGTFCDVSPDRFKDTRVGARVQCEWR